MPAAPLRIFDSPDAIGTEVASRILAGITAAEREGRRYLLGLPTGRTPRPVYAAMARALTAAPRSLAHVTLVMMDEYLVETPSGFAYALASGAPSCHEFTRVEIAGALNAPLTSAQRLSDENLWFPDPREAGEYDDDITIAGGIDFFLLASGAGDGHVAFNAPGSARDSRSRIVTLGEQTRRDNLLTFPALGTVDRVPKFGTTVGIATILAAREAVMVAWGEGKRETVQRMRAASSFDPAWPATVIHECAMGELLVDRAAADSVATSTASTSAGRMGLSV